MQAFILLIAVCSLGYVSAAPCGSSCMTSQNTCSTLQTSSSTSQTTCSNSAYTFFRSSYTQKCAYEYYSAEICNEYDMTIPDYLPTILFQDLESEFYRRKCELLQRYSVFPRNIGPVINQYSTDELVYDYIVMGTSLTSLFIIQQLAAQGLKIAVVDSGTYYPPMADSLDFRTAMLNSQYVRPFKAYITGCDIPKNLYAPNVIGGQSMVGYQYWDTGYEKFYKGLSQYCSKFSWADVHSYYEKYEHCEKKETSTTVKSDSCGQISITKTVRQTSVTRRIQNAFTELGYSDVGSSISSLLSEGLFTVPRIGSQEKPQNIPEYIFNNIQNKENINFILGVEIDQLIIQNGKISGVQVIGKNGPITIGCIEEVIMGTSSLIAFELLIKSGLGSPNLLNTLGIPQQIALPSLGSQLMVTPNYCGCFLRFPSGTFVSEIESDFTEMALGFGQSYLSSSSQISFQKAYFAVGGSPDVNVQLSFYVFTKYTSKSLVIYMKNLFQLEQCAIDYVLDMIEMYDIVFLSYALLDSQSKGYITYKSDMSELDLNLGMYSNPYDIQCITDTIQISNKIANTQSFRNLGAELMQLPVPGCQDKFFTDEVNRISLLFHSFPGPNVNSIINMGTDISNSVVDSQFRIYGITNLRYVSCEAFPRTVPFSSIALNSFLAKYTTDLIINKTTSSQNTQSITTRSIDNSFTIPGPMPTPGPSGPQSIPCLPGSVPSLPGQVPPVPCPSGSVPSLPGQVPPVPCPPGSTPMPCLPEPQSPFPPGSGPIPSASGSSIETSSTSTSQYESGTTQEIKSSGITQEINSGGTSSATRSLEESELSNTEQSNTSMVEGTESVSTCGDGMRSGSSFSETEKTVSESEYEKTIIGSTGMASVCTEENEYSATSQATTMVSGCGC